MDNQDKKTPDEILSYTTRMVRIIYQPPTAKVNLVGKKGRIVNVISDGDVYVYEIEIYEQETDIIYKNTFSHDQFVMLDVNDKETTNPLNPTDTVDATEVINYTTEVLEVPQDTIEAKRSSAQQIEPTTLNLEYGVSGKVNLVSSTIGVPHVINIRNSGSETLISFGDSDIYVHLHGNKLTFSRNDNPDLSLTEQILAEKPVEYLTQDGENGKVYWATDVHADRNNFIKDGGNVLPKLKHEYFTIDLSNKGE